MYAQLLAQHYGMLTLVANRNNFAVMSIDFARSATKDEQERVNADLVAFERHHGIKPQGRWHRDSLEFLAGYKILAEQEITR